MTIKTNTTSTGTAVAAQPVKGEAAAENSNGNLETGLADLLEADGVELEETAAESEGTDQTGTEGEAATDNQNLGSDEGESTAEAGEAEGQEDSRRGAEDAEGDEDQGTGLTPGVQKRLDRLYARAKTAEEQLAEMRAEVTELKAKKANSQETIADSQGPDNESPVVRELKGQEDQQRNLLGIARKLNRQLARDPDGVKAYLEGQKLQLSDWSAEGMGEWLENVMDTASDKLRDVSVKRELATVQAQQQQAHAKSYFDGKANEQFPWLADPKLNPELNKTANAILQQRPWLKKEPAYLVMTGLMAEWMQKHLLKPEVGGRKPEVGGSAGTLRPTQVKPANTIRPGSGSGAKPQVLSAREAARATAQSKFDKKPSKEGLVDLIANMPELVGE